jgi:hypothetical protein
LEIGADSDRCRFETTNLRFEEGDSGARISANSMSGTIELCREDQSIGDGR